MSQNHQQTDSMTSPCVTVRGARTDGRKEACWLLDGEQKGEAISIKEGTRNASRIHRSPASHIAA